MFGEALSLHQAGRLTEAESLYRRILELEKRHFDSCHHLGLIHYQRGEYSIALSHIDAALKLNPSSAAAHNNRGVVLAAFRRLKEAIDAYDKAIALKPDYVDALFNRGNALKELARFDEALTSYDRVVAITAAHAAALCGRGIVLYALGRFEEAIASFERAIALRPEYVEAHSNRGAALAALRRFADAISSYDFAIALNPNDAGALKSRGLAHAALGRFSDAVASYDRALASNPDDCETHAHCGNALCECKQFEDAVASYEHAIALNSDHAEAQFGRGNALSELKRFDSALASYDRAIALKSDYAEAFNNRGNVLNALRRFDEALADYDRAIGIKSDYPDAHNNRGTALRELRRFAEALESYRKAIVLKPDSAEYTNNLAIVLADLKRFDEALANYAKAIALKPDYAEAYNNRGFALRDLKRFDQAVADFAQALAMRPDLDYLKGTHLHAKMHVCNWIDFDKDCQQINAALTNGRAAALPFQLLAIPTSPDHQFRCARLYGLDYDRTPGSLWRGERYAHDRIRVGYVSADLREHPIAMLTAGLFERHDRGRFEIVAISLKSDSHNKVRERMSTLFERFVDAERMSDREIAELIRGFEIDILIDLNGFTEGSRPNIFASRAAPVQVNYLGYAGTLGQDYYDYIIADRFVVPEADHAYYAEQVVYLPDCFMVNDCGRKISARTPSRAEAWLPDKGFVFCCFNNSYKITPHVFDVWMRLLREIKGSVLWLSATNEGAVANLRREATSRGVAADRLIFAPRVPLNEDHLARLRLADLFLDTFYYNAHATAADALWAGVPVLTCAGATFASRVAGSLLNAVGLPELVTTSIADYEELALTLVRDPARLGSLRERLEGNRDVHPLFDTALFTRHLEAAYTTMWERTQRGEPAQSFAVSPIERGTS